MLKKLFIGTVCLLSCVNLFAQNPGTDASDCVRQSVNGYKVTLTNVCSEKIFVIYCGNLRWSNSGCGDYEGGGYYTHSNNIQPGGSTWFDLKDNGRYAYGACYGSISFGKKGYFEDYPNGNYECLAN